MERYPSGAEIHMLSYKCRRCGYEKTKQLYTDDDFLGGF